MAPTELIRISDEYRRALRGFAATVTIVSCRAGLQNYGITVTAVSSISMMPPSLLIAINEKTSIHASLIESTHFCVNILGEDQRFQSQLFGSPMSLEERFDQGDWRLSPDDVPYLADAQANIFCRKVDTHRFGTHSMFIGQVCQLAIGDDIAPLMYLNGQYMKASDLQPVKGHPR